MKLLICKVRVAPIAATLALLGGLVLTRHDARSVPAEADAHHASIRALVAGVPYRIGSWVGVDREVSKGAERMLRPNVILNRCYRNLETGQTVSLLLVHCRDSRDLLGHWPKNCFPSQGWTMRSEMERSWDVHGRRLTGKRYEFVKDCVDRPAGCVVDNLLLVPDGTMAFDMDAVSRAAQDQHLRHFGAAQVQVTYETSMPDRAREMSFEVIVGENLELIGALLGHEWASGE